ncbi:hypothetical protein [Trichodesmium erythraeum]|uniref:hypothetical protein n=1 Tax=Trichodesmium erythraeum TaxID=1206 RepID=UPI00003C9B58
MALLHESSDRQKLPSGSYSNFQVNRPQWLNQPKASSSVMKFTTSAIACSSDSWVRASQERRNCFSFDQQSSHL